MKDRHRRYLPNQHAAPVAALRARVRCSYCGKMGYPNRGGARRMIKAMRREHVGEEGDGRILNAYPCEDGPEGVDPLWHVGHTSDRHRRPDLNQQ